MRSNYFFVAILFMVVLLLTTLSLNERPVTAQAPAPLPFQYVVKFVCGKSPVPGQTQVVAPGTYFTAINVHNPAADIVGFRKKFAVALPKEKAGLVSPFFDAKLGPDEALEIDCGDIFSHVHAQGSFLKGFAIIQSKTELDVVAVYTAAGASGQVETMDVERVEPRRVSGGGGSPDLVPVPDANGNFCRRDPAGRLIVTVKNQGTADAGPSVTKVSFTSGGTVSVATPAIPAGGSVDVFAAIPAGCFSPDCGFRIVVDATAVVSESNELNNTASGTCIG